MITMMVNRRMVWLEVCNEKLGLEWEEKKDLINSHMSAAKWKLEQRRQ